MDRAARQGARPRARRRALEGREVGWAASGRNGGFCAASLTHGLGNGLARWPGEMATLEELGGRNLDAIEEAVARYGIDCDFERTGEIDVATEPHQVEELRELAEQAPGYGFDLDCSTATRSAPRSTRRPSSAASGTGAASPWSTPPSSPGALSGPASTSACASTSTPRPLRLAAYGAGMAVRTPYGRVLAHQVALGTNVFPSLLERVRPYTVPVYDYALMTEPLSAEQLASIGWRNRQGLGDSANQFHYFRLSADNRILWGGYDAVYHYGGRVSAEHDQRPRDLPYPRRALLHCFPQLDGPALHPRLGRRDRHLHPLLRLLRHGPRRRVAYAAGYTGLGVGATRFGAEVMLDLLAGERTERTELEMVRSKPLPFPPEPLPGPASSSPSGRSPAPTTTAADATSG